MIKYILYCRNSKGFLEESESPPAERLASGSLLEGGAIIGNAPLGLSIQK